MKFSSQPTITLLFLLSLSCVNSSIVYTVSGFGLGGGYMSVQQHIAYSSVVSGAGIVAGGPYYCSLGSMVRIQSACSVNPWLTDVSLSISQATISSTDGTIDPLSGLAQDNVYIFSGSLDQAILPALSQSLETFYSNFITTGTITTNYSVQANHAWVTVSEGNPCSYFGRPFINACGFDLSGAILTSMYGTLNAKTVFNNTNLFSFEQSDYADVWQAGMSTRGWVYAPTSCQNNPVLCKVHVNFHGCEQNYDRIGNTYIKEIGLAEWAESNNIIIIFPQVAAGASNNHRGCWDVSGYTGANFYLKSGLQVAAINAIAQNITTIVQANKN